MDRKTKIILGIIGVVIIALVVVIVYIASVYNNVYDDSVNIVETSFEDFSNIENSETVTKVDIVKIDKKEDTIYNIVLSGLDTRSYDENSRSDSTIFVSYNTKTQTVKMISLMRDSWVYIPIKDKWDRINSSSVYGGIGLLINTINYDFDLDIQNYVQVKFSDFKSIIDMLGGLDVELTAAEIKYINNKLHVEDKDYNNDITDSAGLVHLNGTQLLWHCRNRTIGNADFGRTDRQREVLSLLIQKACSMSKAEMAMMIAKGSEYINTNMELSTISKMAASAIGNEIRIESYRLPFEGTYQYANKNGASVLGINILDNAKELHKILGYDDFEDLELNIPDEPIYKDKTTNTAEVKTEETEKVEKDDTENELVENSETMYETTDDTSVTETDIQEQIIEEPTDETTN